MNRWESIRLNTFCLLVSEGFLLSLMAIMCCGGITFDHFGRRERYSSIIKEHGETAKILQVRASRHGSFFDVEFKDGARHQAKTGLVTKGIPVVGEEWVMTWDSYGIIFLKIIER